MAIQEQAEVTLVGSSPTALSIYAKLHAIMQDNAYIQKDKENAFHKYRYASESVIKEKLHVSFVQHRVFPQFSIIDCRERTGAGKEGKETVTLIQMHYKFTCIDTGQYIEGTFFGSGADALDKGVYKALTGALKYILTSNFLISTGDDPESEDAVPVAERKRRAKEVGARKVAQFREHELQESDVPKPSGRVPFDVLKSFQSIKEELRKLTVDDLEYYAVLELNGYKKSNEIPNTDKARLIYKQLAEILKAMRARSDYARLIADAKAKMDEKTWWKILGANGLESLDAATIRTVGPQVLQATFEEMQRHMVP